MALGGSSPLETRGCPSERIPTVPLPAVEERRGQPDRSPNTSHKRRRTSSRSLRHARVAPAKKPSTHTLSASQ